MKDGYWQEIATTDISGSVDIRFELTGLCSTLARLGFKGLHIKSDGFYDWNGTTTHKISYREYKNIPNPHDFPILAEVKQIA